MHTDDFLDTVEMANLLKVSPQKLKKDRLAKKGLPFTKIDRTVRYSRAAVERYLELATVYPSETHAERVPIQIKRPRGGRFL